MTPNDRSAAERLRASTPEDERRLVAALSESMLTKLAENRGKLHWQECAPEFLLGRLDAEVEELRQALGGYLEEGSAEADDVWREAADVANFAAMLAENATGPRHTADAIASDASVPEPPTETGGEADAAKELLGDLEYCWCAGDERPAQATEETPR